MLVASVSRRHSITSAPADEPSGTPRKRTSLDIAGADPSGAVQACTAVTPGTRDHVATADMSICPASSRRQTAKPPIPRPFDPATVISARTMSLKLGMAARVRGVGSSRQAR